jgi:hypothetical protein
MIFDIQNYPPIIATQEDAELLISDARRLRLEYEELKAQHVLHLKKAFANVQRADLQLFQIDLHIGRLQHLICNSGLQEVSPAIVRSKGTESKPCLYMIIFS